RAADRQLVPPADQAQATGPGRVSHLAQHARMIAGRPARAGVATRAATLSAMSVDVSEVAPAEAAARPRDEDGRQVVGVRSAAEPPDGVIEGDVLIPLAELSARAGEIDPQRPALIYCRSGARSAMAVAALRTAGYDAHNLAGGMIAWLQAGLPAATGA